MAEEYRLDVFVAARENITRQRAQEKIQKGLVIVDEKICKKQSTKVSLENIIEILEEEVSYVSRGGFKLAAALDEFNIPTQNKICLDIGASTGGFTDCLLQRGAKKVIAVDVGSMQLAEKLRQDERVISMEKTDIRSLEKEALPYEIDLITADLSFISLKNVTEHILKFANFNTDMIFLIKPQFEAGIVKSKSGVIRDKKIHEKILKGFSEYFLSLGLLEKGRLPSPIKGAKGNQEYLVYLKRGFSND